MIHEIQDEPESVNAKTIWLLLLKEGGWWSAREVYEKVGGEVDVVHRTIRQMVMTGTVKRRRPDGGVIGYAVDKHCKVPRFMVLNELMEAGVV